MKVFSYKNFALVIGLVIVIGLVLFVTYPRYFDREVLVETTPSREADAGCKWEKKSGAELEFWGAYCDYGDKKYHTVINGTEVSVEEITENGPVTIKNVIQVFSLVGNKIEDVIPFLQIQSRRPWNIADKCVFTKDDQNSTTEVARYILKPTGDVLVKLEQDCKTGPVLDSCAGYGIACSGIRYFEIHASNPRNAIFVEYGQEPPMFDEKTIKVK